MEFKRGFIGEKKYSDPWAFFFFLFIGSSRFSGGIEDRGVFSFLLVGAPRPAVFPLRSLPRLDLQDKFSVPLREERSMRPHDIPRSSLRRFFALTPPPRRHTG